MRRVAVTGIGVVSPIGASLEAVAAALREGRTGVRAQPAWARIGALATRLGGSVEDVELDGLPRKKVRTMGRVARLALVACDAAIADAGLRERALRSERTGLAYGSTHGSSSAYEAYCRPLFARDSFEGLPATAYLRFMSHTCAANLAQAYEITGRVITTCAACVSSSQAIGAGYDAIRHGLADVMICGGAEELHYTHAGVFDAMGAASARYNDHPERSPRPFDRDRDGLVVGEGAGTLILEELGRARARGARVHAEIAGYATNCDGTHVTQPSARGMARVMRLALEDARLAPEDVAYVNAHATATEIGDIRESRAVAEVFGARVPVSSTKGHMGHTLGACGAIEAILCVAMMQRGFVAPTRNLDAIDPRCAELDYVRGEPRALTPEVVMTNNFAFGGINTSLVLRRPP